MAENEAPERMWLNEAEASWCALAKIRKERDGLYVRVERLEQAAHDLLNADRDSYKFLRALRNLHAVLNDKEKQ